MCEGVRGEPSNADGAETVLGDDSGLLLRRADTGEGALLFVGDIGLPGLVRVVRRGNSWTSGLLTKRDSSRMAGGGVPCRDLSVLSGDVGFSMLRCKTFMCQHPQ